MICKLNCIKNECKAKIKECSEPELNAYFERLGLFFSELLIQTGPWGTFILRSNKQEIAIGPSVAKQLLVETF
jgi:hypothetical protein